MLHPCPACQRWGHQNLLLLGSCPYGIGWEGGSWHAGRGWAAALGACCSSMFSPYAPSWSHNTGLSLFRLAELPSEKSRVKHTCFTAAGQLLVLLAGGPPCLGIGTAPICKLGCCHCTQRAGGVGATHTNVLPLTLVFAAGDGSFVGFFYDFSFIRRKRKALKGTGGSDTG